MINHVTLTLTSGQITHHHPLLCTLSLPQGTRPVNPLSRRPGDAAAELAGDGDGRPAGDHGGLHERHPRLRLAGRVEGSGQELCVQIQPGTTAAGADRLRMHQ